MYLVMENITTEIKFEQVCVWPFTLVAKGEEDAFAEFFKDTFGVKVKFICENKVSEKQTDALFYIASDDIGKFAVPRLQAGIRWLEDVIDNENARGGSYPLPRGVERCW